MTTRCPSCKATFEVDDREAGRRTATCPACGRVVILAAGPPAADDDPPTGEPSTAPYLEPLSRAETPTRIGVASQTLSLPRDKRVSVAILSGPRKGEAVTLDRPRLTIGGVGTGAKADVQVPDPNLAPEHAAIECYDNRIVLRDLGTASGTYVGTERVTRKEIEGRTEFRVGDTTFLLVLSE